MTAPTFHPQASSPASRPGLREWGLIGCLLLAGLAARVAFPERMAVEHFDEGVYASNIFFGAEQNFQYPARYLYAPPLLPWLVEWSLILLGGNHWGTMLIGLAAGTLTILMIWWLARRWFGVAAGLIAGGLCAFSDFHITYSRTVLTEPLLGLWLVAAVYFLWRAVVDFHRPSAVLAGLCTGLAWCTKYNGWLPLAIGITGLSAWAIRPQSHSPDRSQRFVMVAAVTVLAGLVFAPVWWWLQDVGGYRVVQENHARYLVGLAGWPSAWLRQLQNHQYLDGPLGWAGLGLAVLLSAMSDGIHRPANEGKASENPIPRSRRYFWTFALAVLLMTLGVVIGTSAVLGTLGLLWLILACPWWRDQSSAGDVRFQIGYWLLAAWFVGLFLATPLYTPYPRLTLPWLVSAWIAAAAMLSCPAGRRLVRGEFSWQSKRWGMIVMSVLLIAGFLGTGQKLLSRPAPRFPAWADRTGLKTSAARILPLVAREGSRTILYVYAEPALFFHLRGEGLEAVAPVADLLFAQKPPTVPTLLVIGPHARRNPQFQQEWSQVADQFSLLATFEYQPSDLVWLDHAAPPTITDPAFNCEQTLEVYRLKGL